MTANTVLA